MDFSPTTEQPFSLQPTKTNESDREIAQENFLDLLPKVDRELETIPELVESGMPALENPYLNLSGRRSSDNGGTFPLNQFDLPQYELNNSSTSFDISPLERNCDALHNVDHCQKLATLFAGQTIADAQQSLTTFIIENKSSPMPLLRAFIQRLHGLDSKPPKSQSAYPRDSTKGSSRFWTEVPYFFVHLATRGTPPLDSHCSRTLYISDETFATARHRLSHREKEKPEEVPGIEVSNVFSIDQLHSILSTFFQHSKLAVLFSDMLVANDATQGLMDPILMCAIICTSLSLVPGDPSTRLPTAETFYRQTRYLLSLQTISADLDQISCTSLAVIMLLLAEYERETGHLIRYFGSVLLASSLLQKVSSVHFTGVAKVKRTHASFRFKALIGLTNEQVEAELATHAKAYSDTLIAAHCLDLLGGLMAADKATFANPCALTSAKHCTTQYRTEKSTNLDPIMRMVLDKSRMACEQRLVGFSLTQHILRIVSDCAMSYNADWLMNAANTSGTPADQRILNRTAATYLMSLIEPSRNDHSVKAKTLKSAACVLALFRLVSLPATRLSFESHALGLSIVLELQKTQANLRDKAPSTVINLCGLAREYTELFLGPINS